MKVRTVEHGNIFTGNTGSHKLINTLRNESGFGPIIGRRDNGGFHTPGISGRAQRFGKLPRILRNSGVGNLKNSRYAAVIGLNFKDIGIRVGVRELKYVVYISSAP